MNAKTDTSGSSLDTLKLVLAGAILLAGIFGYYWFASAPIALRALGVLVAAGAAAFVAYQSAPGQTFWRFVQSARIELRKVVWPNRQETLTFTGVVLAFAVILGLFFWGLDLLLAWVTRTATGLGG